MDPIHPLHVAEDLWGLFDPEKALDAEDRDYRAESLTVLLETLKTDRYTIINELERRVERVAETEKHRQQWKSLGGR